MKGSIRIVVAACAVFVVILLARFPAKWAKPFLPKDVSCDQIGGSLWDGVCLGLTVRGMPSGDIKWSLHPLRIFAGKLGADVSYVRGAMAVEGDVSVTFSGSIAARKLKARMPLDPALLPMLPPGVRGVASADLASLRIEGKTVKAVEGLVEVRGLEQGPGRSLGDFRLTFPPGGSGDEPVGQLQDLGGPITVIGTVKLTKDPGYELEGRVGTKAGAPDSIARQLQILGRPDAQGLRPFSLADTF